MILTEQEIKDAVGFTTDQMTAYRKIESAVLEKLKAQEPVAWRYENKNVKGNWYITWTEPNDTFNKRGLYEHPLPPADVVRDAERYRWLVGEAESVQCRFFDWETIGGDYGERDETLDAAIDAAMEGMK